MIDFLRHLFHRVFVGGCPRCWARFARGLKERERVPFYQRHPL